MQPMTWTDRYRSSRTRSEVVEILKDVTTCAYCQQSLLNTKWHIDHVIPVSRGGPDSHWNMVKCCQFCNLSKSNKLPSSDGWAPAIGTKVGDGSIVKSRHQWSIIDHPMAIPSAKTDFFFDSRKLFAAQQRLGDELLGAYLFMFAASTRNDDSRNWSICDVMLSELSWALSMPQKECEAMISHLGGVGAVSVQHNDLIKTQLEIIFVLDLEYEDLPSAFMDGRTHWRIHATDAVE